jgi:predicted nucleotidyltransferase
VIGATEGVAGIFVGQRFDDLSCTSQSVALAFGHFFHSCVNWRRNHHRHLHTLGQGDVGSERYNTILDATANDHIGIIPQNAQNASSPGRREPVSPRVSAFSAPLRKKVRAHRYSNVYLPESRSTPSRKANNHATASQRWQESEAGWPKTGRPAVFSDWLANLSWAVQSATGSIGRTHYLCYNPIMKDIPPELLDEIVRRLVEELQPEEIYLFGSHATGTPHRHSDLDLLVVVSDDAADRHELVARGYLALYGIRTPIDLVVQCRADIGKWALIKPSLPYEATQKGKRIYAAAVGVGA